VDVRTRGGRTLGKWALGIRVIAADGSKLCWPRAVGRVPAFLVASAPLKFGFLAILWDERRRGWYDHLAGTMVVRAGSGGAAPAAGAAYAGAWGQSALARHDYCRNRRGDNL